MMGVAKAIAKAVPLFILSSFGIGGYGLQRRPHLGGVW